MGGGSFSVLGAGAVCAAVDVLIIVLEAGVKSVSVHESLSLVLTLLECLIPFSVGVLDL